MHDDLAPVDSFHTRGRESTHEVAGLTVIGDADLILDVGCGLGGTARYLAHHHGCRVVGIDLTEEYITVGKKLTELVQMNIADKDRFYTEIARVSAKITADGLPPVGLHLLMGDSARDKLHILWRNLDEDRVSIALGMARNLKTLSP